MLAELKRAIVELNISGVSDIVEKALSAGFDSKEILEALRSGMEDAGHKFAVGEYFLSDLIMAGETMKEALKVLHPCLRIDAQNSVQGKVVLGTILGDLHDIGKEIVKTLLISAGFEVHDLGIDVPPEKFVEEARKVGAYVIGVSALLSTTVPTTAKIVQCLKEEKAHDEIKTIIGGAACRLWMVEKYGVHAAVNDAVEGIDIIKSWMRERCALEKEY